MGLFVHQVDLEVDLLEVYFQHLYLEYLQFHHHLNHQVVHLVYQLHKLVLHHHRHHLLML